MFSPPQDFVAQRAYQKDGQQRNEFDVPGKPAHVLADTVEKSPFHQRRCGVLATVCKSIFTDITRQT